MKITFEVDGRIKFIYDDTVAEVMREVGGKLNVKRASHVEPTVCDLYEGGPKFDGWQADMSPVGGPVLGPYGTRGQALDAERNYLVSLDIPRPR